MAVPGIKLGYMNAENIREWLQRRPFEPFVVRLSSGVTHEVRHPENAILTKSKLVIVYPESDRVAICALLHIASFETPQSA